MPSPFDSSPHEELTRDLDPGPFAAELRAAVRLAAAAAAAIRTRYLAGPAAVRRKADHSPVTDADLEANAIIVGGLAQAFPQDAILSEESPDPPARFTAERVWLVDPLDGTRDYVERSGDFAVHVALALAGRPVVSAVALPAHAALAAAVRGGGARLLDPEGARTLRVAPVRPFATLRTGVSRYALNQALSRFLDRTGLADHAEAHGASTKHLRLADGRLDLCLTLHGRESEWDSAAPGLIVEEAGGRVTDIDGAPLRYNQPDVRHRRGVAVSSGAHHDAILAVAHEYFGP